MEDLTLQLELESGDVIPFPTDVDLARIDGEEFAILSSTDSNTFVQCAKEFELPLEYILEYQDGSVDNHFRATDEAIPLIRIVSVSRK